jgi:hypothetical protein
MHVEQAGQPMTTGDGPALQGYYTTDLWRAGDLVVDERAIELPRPFDPSQDKVTVGMYDLATFRRLPVLNADGTPAGDSVVLQPQ